MGLADVFVNLTRLDKIFTVLFLLYCIDIFFHDYSEFSAAGGFAAFFTFLAVLISQIKQRFLGVSLFLAPLTLLVLAIFFARSTMTVAFLYFSINLTLLRLT